MKFEQNLLSASEEKLFENVNGGTHGGTNDDQKVITIAHPEYNSGELKIECHLLQILLATLRVRLQKACYQKYSQHWTP